ncbi:MAG: ROK family protein [Aigarchaeota archaeon]|nr:ROK family protein [Candidatus Calditenuaceae archaeon]
MILAADVGATNMRVGLFSEKGELLRVKLGKTPQTQTHETVPRALLNLAKDVAGSEWSSIKSCGVASIGPLDSKRGVILKAPNIAEKGRDIPLLAGLTKELDVDYYFLNDCNAAAYGEWWAVKEGGVKNLIYITISSGIGGGVVDNRHLILGKQGNGAEIGHIVIDATGYMDCGCGGLGHWEAYCSGANIPRLAAKLLHDDRLERGTGLERSIEIGALDAKQCFELYYAGDPAAKRLFEFLKDCYAAGLTSVINAFDAEVLVLGGAIYLRNEDFFNSEVIPRIDKFLLLDKPRISKPVYGDLAPLYGAALCARDEIEGARVTSPLSW